MEENMKISRRQATRTVFIAFFALASVNLVQSTANWVEFNRALNNLELKALAIDFNVNNIESLNITIDFELQNPTAFDSFVLKSISSAFRYEGEPHTVVISPGGPRIGTPYQAINTTWWDLPPGGESYNSPIKAYSTTKLTLTNWIVGVEVARFADYFEKMGQNKTAIKWSIDSRLFIDTPTFMGMMGLEYHFDI